MGKICQEDKILIKNLRIDKAWSVRKTLQGFPNKHWRKTGLDRLLEKLTQLVAMSGKLAKKRFWTRA